MTILITKAVAGYRPTTLDCEPRGDRRCEDVLSRRIGKDVCDCGVPGGSLKGEDSPVVRAVQAGMSGVSRVRQLGVLWIGKAQTFDTRHSGVTKRNSHKLSLRQLDSKGRVNGAVSGATVDAL